MNDSKPFQRASAAALRFLSYRPRSEAEVRARLLRSFPSEVVEEVIESLSEQTLVDDTKFSQLWTDSRISHRPRSASVIKRELITKGIDRDVAEDAVREVDDQDSAYRAGLKLTRRLEQADLTVFRRKMWGYLQRRGFGGTVVRHTVARLWDELQENRGSPDDAEGC